MRILVSVFCLIFTGCIHAQQSFPGINITPNGGNAGKIQLRTSANVNSMFIQDATISAASAGKAITITGATATDGRILLNPGNVAGKASVQINSPNTTDAGLILVDGNSSANSNGLQMQLLNGTGYLKVDSSFGLQPTYTALNNKSHYFFANNGLGGAVIISNSGGTISLESESIVPSTASTYDLGQTGNRWNNVYGITGNFSNAVLGSGTGSLKVTGGTVGLVSGSATDCVLVNGTSSPCSGSTCSAWNTTTPTVASNVGSPSTSLIQAAWCQLGKVAYVRLYWIGSISGAATQITFNSASFPTSLSVATFQAIPFIHSDATAGTLPTGYSYIQGGTQTLGFQPTAAVTSGNTLTIAMTGVYQTN